MPIYEFYCDDCHTIFNFLSARVNTETRPACPKCARPELARQVTTFSISKGRGEEGPDDDFPDLDESAMERAMESMAGEMENLDEDDPSAMGRVMRRLLSASGMSPGEGLEEALSRMEAGEDPDRIEEEMGDLLEDEDALVPRAKPTLRELRRLTAPRKDETLYEL
jgi:putative FmdB family regulatory protein